jgi:hypothetical protein
VGHFGKLFLGFERYFELSAKGRNVNGQFGGHWHLWSGKIMVAFLMTKQVEL